MDKLGYDPIKDFAYITQVFIVPNLLVVPADFPAKDIKELIALAKAKPDYFVAGHAGVGTSQHLAGELFMSMAHVKIQQVPYRGTTQVLPDLLGGRLNIFFGNISNVLPLVREGKLRAFAVTSRKRSPQIPELPTMEELGFPDYDATAWFGLQAPAGTPKPIIDKLHDETVKVIWRSRTCAAEARRARPATCRQHAGRVSRSGEEGNADVGQGHQGRRHQARAIAERRTGRATMMRSWTSALGGRCCLRVAQPRAAQAQYPDKPVRFIVGFTAGSATDITARMFAQKFQEAWGVPVTVENVPGAGGSVGGDRVAKSAPDGTTFYWGANGALTINPTLLTSQTYDVTRDLTPVARLLVMPSILAVNNDVPAKSFAEFVALAKAQPGKLSYASPGTGTPQHIAGEMLKSQAGIDIVHVPYRGAVFTDVIGGRVTMTLQNMGSILPIVREGQLRGLAVTSLMRTPIMPALPTVAESGLPGFEAISWFGLMAPAGTPAPIISKVYQQAAKIATRCRR